MKKASTSYDNTCLCLIWERQLVSLYMSLYMSLYVTIYHYMSLYITIYHYMSLCITICHYICIYVTISVKEAINYVYNNSTATVPGWGGDGGEDHFLSLFFFLSVFTTHKLKHVFSLHSDAYYSQLLLL